MAFWRHSNDLEYEIHSELKAQRWLMAKGEWRMLKLTEERPTRYTSIALFKLSIDMAFALITRGGLGAVLYLRSFVACLLQWFDYLMLYSLGSCPLLPSTFQLVAVCLFVIYEKCISVALHWRRGKRRSWSWSWSRVIAFTATLRAHPLLAATCTVDFGLNVFFCQSKQRGHVIGMRFLHLLLKYVRSLSSLPLFDLHLRVWIFRFWHASLRFFKCFNMWHNCGALMVHYVGWVESSVPLLP